MIPAKQRRIITTIFDLHGRDIPLHMDERLADDKFYVVEGSDGASLVGGVRFINWARDILSNVFVPECFDDEASTWA